MTDSNAAHDRLHQAMHRLPGVPDHGRADELNSNRAGRVRAVKVNEAGRARAQRWHVAGNEAAARRHAQPPRVAVRVQEFIARVLRLGP
jgi:hypothetical protein